VSSPLDAVPRLFLRDEAYARLREAIVVGALAPGQTVVIDDLASQLGLSTMPVREAIAALVRDGLIEALPSRAHRVTVIQPTDAASLAEVIATVTIRVYELGAPMIGPDAVERMRAAIAEHDAAMAVGELPRAVRAVEAFHGEVFAVCGNPDYLNLLSGLVARWERIMLLLFPDAIERFGPDIMGLIVEAFDAGDAARAVDVVRATWTGFAQLLASFQPQATSAQIVAPRAPVPPAS
jgi:DNA-binding GntR family transcriptional regulator